MHELQVSDTNMSSVNVKAKHPTATAFSNMNTRVQLDSDANFKSMVRIGTINDIN